MASSYPLMCEHNPHLYRAQAVGPHALQGCVRCRAAFYFTRYPNEGLCSRCEASAYPDRYRGCLFCRCICDRDLPFCFMCGHGFQKWAAKHTNAMAPWAGIQAAFRMLSDPRAKDIYHAFIPGKYDKPSDTWPGFYAGNGTWVIPTERMETQERMTADNGHELLERLLLAHGIDIYADIQIKTGLEDWVFV